MPKLECSNSRFPSATFVPKKKYLENLTKAFSTILHFEKFFLILPSNLTVNGTVKSRFLVAFTIPFAMVAQLTIPPKTLTNKDFTFESTIKI